MRRILTISVSGFMRGKAETETEAEAKAKEG